MRALGGGILRAFKSHKTPEGAAYGAYCRAKQERLGPLGRDALPTLREAGLAVVELRRLSEELEAVRARKKRTEVRRIRREQGRLRGQLLSLERRLEELAARNDHGGDLARQLQAAIREGEGDED